MMKRVLIFVVFVSAFVFSCGPDGCESAGCGTVALPPVTYKGSPTAQEPYIQTGEITMRSRGCTGNLCGESAGLRPWVHNPTGIAVVAHVQCRYFLDGATLGYANPAKVGVKAHHSRRLEGFDFLYDVPAVANGSVGWAFSAECSADFGPNWPVSISSNTVSNNR